MNAFITGSQAYGTPTSKSDVDLVIYVDPETKQKLIDLSDHGKMPCKYGKLNLIMVTTPEEAAVWLMGRSVCMKEAPVDFDTAKEIHDTFRRQVGIEFDMESGPK